VKVSRVIVVCFRNGLKSCSFYVVLHPYLMLFVALRTVTVTSNVRFILLTLTLRFCHLHLIASHFVMSYNKIFNF